MEIPTDVKTYEMASSIIWISKEGIVYSTPKNETPRELSDDEIKEEMNKFRDIIGHKKVCIVIEANSKARPTPKEQRDFIAAELASVTRAMALITSSPVSRIVANLFFGFKPPLYPVKIFSNEPAASSWIMQYV